MPFDASFAVSPAAPCLLNGIDLSPLLSGMEEKKANAARLGLAMGYLHEELMAAVAQVEVATLRDWRVNRTGPASAKLGQAIFYPIDSVKLTLEQAMLGTRALERSRRR